MAVHGSIRGRRVRAATLPPTEHALSVRVGQAQGPGIVELFSATEFLVDGRSNHSDSPDDGRARFMIAQL
jgi:hypothetical protein